MFEGKKASNSWVPGTKVSIIASCTVNEHIHITLSFLLRPLVEMGVEEPDYGMNRYDHRCLILGGDVFIYKKLKNKLNRSL